MSEETTTTETEETTSQTETTSESGDTSTVTEGDKTFNQDQVNKLIAKRVREVKNQFKDYDELKNSVTKLQEQIDSLTKEKKDLENKYKEDSFVNALNSVARELNLDAELATKLLDKDKVIFKDDKPDNLKELLQAVIEKHPNLVKKTVATPDVTTTQTEKPQFSLHKSSKSNFFKGGGIRINMPQSSMET